MKRKGPKDHCVLSIKKIICNLLRYWWIVVLCIGMSVGYIIVTQSHNSMIDKGGSNLEYRAIVGIQDQNENTEGSMEEQYYSRMLKGHILQDSLKLLNSDDGKRAIKDSLASMGYKDFDQNADTPECAPLVEGDNIIVFKLSGLNAKRTTAILESYVEQLDHICKGLQENFEIKTLSMSDKQAIDQSDSGLLNKKNIFLIFTSIIFGIGVVGLLLLYDKRIYTKHELEQLYSCKCIGDIVVSKYENKYNYKVEIIRLMLKQQNISTVVTFNMDSTDVEALQSIFPEIKVSNCIKGIDNTQNILNSDVAIVGVHLGRDTDNGLDEMLEVLETINMNIIGYIAKK